MKKTLKTILNERIKTIEYRAIRKQCMTIAQNKGTFMLRINITPETIIMLQNEMLTVEKINDGTEKYKISW
jgi:hypothetical protein